jgi:hypothetical protein
MQSIADLFHATWPFLIAIASAGPIVWFATEFVARPIRHFFDIKRQAKQLTLLLWDAPEYGRQSNDEWEAEMALLQEKRERLTELSAEIFSFAQSERFAVMVVRAVGYDPAGAGRAAKKIAFELGTNIEDRSKNYKKLDTLLKFTFDPKRPFYNPYNAGP